MIDGFSRARKFLVRFSFGIVVFKVFLLIIVKIKGLVGGDRVSRLFSVRSEFSDKGGRVFLFRKFSVFKIISRGLFGKYLGVGVL